MDAPQLPILQQAFLCYRFIVFLTHYSCLPPSHLTSSSFLMDNSISISFFISVAVQNITQSGQSSPWGSKISPKDIRDPNFWTVTLLYPCIYGILVDVAVKMFALLALQLTKFENHRTQSTFINRLVLKVISHFQFCLSMVLYFVLNLLNVPFHILLCIIPFNIIEL